MKNVVFIITIISENPSVLDVVVIRRKVNAENLLGVIFRNASRTAARVQLLVNKCARSNFFPKSYIIIMGSDYIT